MAQLVVRNLEDGVKARLQRQASRHGHSMEEEVREILNQHSDEMRRTGVSYQDMYKKVKGELARQRKLILR